MIDINLIEFAQKVKGWVLDILFPIPETLPEIKLNQTLFCPVCRARLPNNSKICHKNSQYKLGAATDYNNELVRRLIWRLKYRNKTRNVSLLGQILIKYLQNCEIKTENYTVVPIPLSVKRFRKRGYNQAALIAKHVAENLRLPLLESALGRVKDAPPQAEIGDWQTRKENIKGCFGIINPELIKGKNIILIDDVFTSGATMSEAAHQLKDFGAKQIIGLVIAKAG